MPESNRLRQKRQKAESSRNRESTGCGPDTLPHRLKRFNSLEGTESPKKQPALTRILACAITRMAPLANGLLQKAQEA